jgi:flagellar biosynthesis/type III secretory pathway M-ring protein FliF/YscJ
MKSSTNDVAIVISFAVFAVVAAVGVGALIRETVRRREQQEPEPEPEEQPPPEPQQQPSGEPPGTPGAATWGSWGQPQGGTPGVATWGPGTGT